MWPRSKIRSLSSHDFCLGLSCWFSWPISLPHWKLRNITVQISDCFVLFCFSELWLKVVSLFFKKQSTLKKSRQGNRTCQLPGPKKHTCDQSRPSAFPFCTKAVVSSSRKKFICGPLAMTYGKKIMADEMALKLFYDFCLSSVQKGEIKKRININFWTNYLI